MRVRVRVGVGIGIGIGIGGESEPRDNNDVHSIAAGFACGHQEGVCGWSCFERGGVLGVCCRVEEKRGNFLQAFDPVAPCPVP